MESQRQINREDEEICLQRELKADRSEPVVQMTGFETGRGPENEESWLLPTLKSDRSELVIEMTGFENEDGTGENGVIWLLPKLKRDRSEPVLEMRDYTTIQSCTGFVRWHVFFSRPSEQSKSIQYPADTRLKNVFSLLSGPSTVNVFQQFLEDDEHKSRFQGVPRFKHKLMEQKHGPNKNFELLQVMNSEVLYGPRVTHSLISCDMEQQQRKSELNGVNGQNKDYNLLKDGNSSMNANVVSDNAIFKQRSPSGNTVLHLAASNGNDVMVEKLAQHAPQLFTVVNDNYDTALHVAAKKGHSATIKLILNKFLLFVRRETNGHGNQSILELMLMVSLALFRNKQGNTFLHEAFKTSSRNGAVIFEAFEAPFIDGYSNKFDEARYKKVVHDLATLEVNVKGKSLLYLTIEANCAQGVNQLMDSCIEGYLKMGKSPLLPPLINKDLGEDRVICLLPQLERDRSEPVLEMRYYTTIQSCSGFARWHVFFSRPSDQSKSIQYPADTHLKNVFSLLSGPSTVNVFQQFPEDEEKEKKVKATTASDDMRTREHKSRFKGVPEDGPNMDFGFLKGGANKDFESDNPIFKTRTPSGNTVLHLAANNGKDAMVKRVAQQAPQLFIAFNDNYDTALHVAAKKGHGATIKLLLNEFLLFVRRETNGHGHQSILELMLMVSLTLFRNKQGNTFLHEAFKTSSHNGAVIFEAFKAPFIVGDSINFDEARYKKVVHDLATFAVNVEGKSLLYLTIEANCEQVVNQLMDSFTDGDLKPKGKSPLLAALINKNLGMLETILWNKQGWEHLRDEQGWLPLHHAVLLGYLQAVRCLAMKCPSCTMERDNNGSLPIHLACKEGHVKIVQELLEYCDCLDPTDMVNDRGQNLLHIACTYANYELVRYLLEDRKLEMMINQKDINGNTPLHLATISWHPKIVHALTWDKRVDLSVLNHDSLTALDIAEVRQGTRVSLSQRLTWNALVSAGTPRSSVRFHPKKVQTDSTSYGTPGSSVRFHPEKVEIDSTSSGTPRSSERFHPKNVETETSDFDKQTHTTEQYKDRIDTLIVVSTLIITTSFAAGFTFPGDAEQGIPILLNRSMFHLFILSLTISLFGAISSTIILMWARLGDLNLAVFALSCAMPLLGLSLTSLSLAFLAGMYLIVCKLSWLATTFLVIGVVLILVVEFLYLLLWLPSTSSLPFFRYISYYPFLFYANIAEGKMDANKMGSKAIVHAR